MAYEQCGKSQQMLFNSDSKISVPVVPATTLVLPDAAEHEPSGELLGQFANRAPVPQSVVGMDLVDGLLDGAGGPAGHQPLPDAPFRLDQAASVQRRANACRRRRKTQPSVRDGLTTTVTSCGK